MVKVCEMNVDIGRLKLPHTEIPGHLGGVCKVYKQFKYNLRLSFGDNGVLGFVLESLTGQEYGRATGFFSTSS